MRYLLPIAACSLIGCASPIKHADTPVSASAPLKFEQTSAGAFFACSIVCPYFTPKSLVSAPAPAPVALSVPLTPPYDLLSTLPPPVDAQLVRSLTSR